MWIKMLQIFFQLGLASLPVVHLLTVPPSIQGRQGSLHRNLISNPTPTMPVTRRKLVRLMPSWRNILQSNNISVDLMFVMDGSPEISFYSSNNFNLLKAWIIRVASGFDITSGNIRIGLIQYSYRFIHRNLRDQQYIQTKIELGSCQNLSCFEKKIHRISLMRYPSCAGAAINKTVMVDFSEARPNSKKIIVLIAHTRSRDDVYYASLYARSQNVTIFSVGVDRYSLEQLQLISNGELDNNWRVYRVADFDHLYEIVSDLQNEIRAEYDIPACPPLIAPDQGRLDCTKTNEVGSNCTYSCHENHDFTVQGSATRTCQWRSGSGAVWDGVPATCGACSGRFDLLVILDTSSNTSNRDFSIIQDVLIRVIDAFHIGSTAVQVSFIHLSDKEIVALWDNNWFLDRYLLMTEFLNLPVTSTCKDIRGLTHAIHSRLHPDTGRRPNERHISLIISDGTSAADIVESTRYLQKVSKILTIGLGQFKQNYFNSISSNPISNHFFSIGGRYYKLFSNFRRIVQTLCDVQQVIDQIRCPALFPTSSNQCELSVNCSNGNRAGSNCTVQCCPGYETRTDPNAICYYNGQWSNTDLTCTEKLCPILTQTEGLLINCSNANYVNSSCTLSCRSGYTISPDQTRNRNCRPSSTNGSVECSTTCLFGFNPYWDHQGIIKCTEINECLAISCQNNGRCVDEVNDFSCDCLPGYTGSLCEYDVDECASSPCTNNGSCRDTINDFECVCLEGYTGRFCELNIDECYSDPCLNNGICHDAVNGYSCSCLVGYRGENCEIESNHCASSPCRHNATCTNMDNSYVCDCVMGYTGRDCEIDIDDCENITCIHGTCLDGINQFTCQCHAGFIGMYCQNSLRLCHSHPCHHNATCLEMMNQNEYSCVCPEGFTGESCHINIDDCNPNTCHNNGTCLDLVNNFTCICPLGFTGRRCETDEDDCQFVVCHNGGTCLDGISTYSCHCPSGYGGLHCDVIIDHCLIDEAREKCQNGGNCSHQPTGYSCFCPMGYDGEFCENEIRCPIDSQMNFSSPRSACVGDRRPGSVCSLRCPEGTGPKYLEGIRIENRTCQSNGQWSIKDKDWGCIRNTCSPLVDALKRNRSSNGSLFIGLELSDFLVSTNCTDGDNINSRCDIICPSNYRFDGPNFSICLPNGQWTQTTTSCKRFQCEAFETDLGITCTNGYRVGSVCNKTCPNGYMLRGPPYKTCLKNATWDSQQRWKCLPACEGFPPSTQHAIYNCSHFNYVGSICTSTCKRGFSPSRQAWFNCTIDDVTMTPRWRGTTGVCEPSCHKSINLDTGRTYGFDENDEFQFIAAPYLNLTKDLRRCAYQAQLRIRPFLNSSVTFRLSYSNSPRDYHLEIAKNFNSSQPNNVTEVDRFNRLIGFGSNLYASQPSFNNSQHNISDFSNVTIILDYERIHIMDAETRKEVLFSPFAVSNNFFDVAFNRLVNNSIGSGLCFVCIDVNNLF